MTIAVSISGVSYDHATALASEQRRIAQFLTFASPRDIDDLSQIMKYTWPSGAFSVTNDTGPTLTLSSRTDFNTFIQTAFTPSGRPSFSVYVRDDNGDLHYLSGSNGTNNVQVATADDTGSSALIGKMARLPDNTIIQIQPGDIVRNGNQAVAAGSTPPAVGSTTTNIAANTAVVVGRVKFEAESGLALAAINTRIADINTVIESLAKILSIQSDMFNAASGLVR